METVVSKYSKPKATVTRRPLLTSKPPCSPAKDAGKISRISTFFFTTWPSAMLTKVRVNKIFEIPNPNGEIMRHNPL